jgi:hypothetical protein
MVNDVKSSISDDAKTPQSEKINWLKISTFAAASALVGGIAAAWWYRKTISKFRETGEIRQNPHFGIPASHSDDD